jgi:hypothetical protein
LSIAAPTQKISRTKRGKEEYKMKTLKVEIIMENPFCEKDDEGNSLRELSEELCETLKCEEIAANYSIKVSVDNELKSEKKNWVN